MLVGSDSRRYQTILGMLLVKSEMSTIPCYVLGSEYRELCMLELLRTISAAPLENVLIRALSANLGLASEESSQICSHNRNPALVAQNPTSRKG